MNKQLKLLIIWFISIIILAILYNVVLGLVDDFYARTHDLPENIVYRMILTIFITIGYSAMLIGASIIVGIKISSEGRN